jgi:hypothetical protein
MINRDMSTMVAVASGNRTQIRRWEASLRGASIECLVAKPTAAAEADSTSRAELWVAEGDAERARTVLQRLCVKDELTMW